MKPGDEVRYEVYQGIVLDFPVNNYVKVFFTKYGVETLPVEDLKVVSSGNFLVSEDQVYEKIPAPEYGEEVWVPLRRRPEWGEIWRLRNRTDWLITSDTDPKTFSGAVRLETGFVFSGKDDYIHFTFFAQNIKEYIQKAKR